MSEYNRITGWEAEPVRHLLRVIRINRQNKQQVQVIPYVQENEPTQLCLDINDNTLEYKLQPFKLEHLKHHIAEDYPTAVVNELYVGIQDNVQIAYVGMLWHFKSDEKTRSERYLFQDDKPSRHSLDAGNGPGWSAQHSLLFDTKLSVYLRELMEIRPTASRSLDRCMKHLTTYEDHGEHEIIEIHGRYSLLL